MVKELIDDSQEAIDLERTALKLVEEALALTPDEINDWLLDACGNNSPLLHRVTDLLAVDRSIDNNNATAAVLPNLDTSPGLAAEKMLDWDIGNYQVKAVIGSGGMGVVYRGVRIAGEYQQEVAIKLLKYLQSDESLVRQFEIERQILARLTHPNIVTLLDGGTTKNGEPYLVTELVDGVTLDNYVEIKQLSLAERLQLFDQICAAVEHAHAELVIHRDIKPSNILVQPDGMPKLLDFGIAKILTDDQERTLVAGFTPSFASPEQMAGSSLSTATDIYSLGAVLYFLLTETLVFEEISSTSAAKLDQIRHTTVDRPSTRVNRDKIPIAVAPDLDAITLKALALEPERRFASVSALRADIENYQQRKPVTAQLDSSWYRLRKFISRHRLGFIASTIAISGLVFGLLISLQQIRVANQQLAKYQAISNFMGDILMSPASRFDVELSAGADAKMSDVLVLAGEHILQELGDYPDVQVDLLSRVSVALERLSKNDQAVKLSKQAMQIATSIRSADLRQRVLTSYGKTLTRSGRSQEGLDALLQVKQMLEAAEKEKSITYLFLLNDLGNAYSTFERFTEQRASIGRAIELINIMGIDQTNPLVAGAYNHLAGVEMRLGNEAAAHAASATALSIVSLEQNRQEVIFAYAHQYAAAFELVSRNFDQAAKHSEIAIREFPKSLGSQTKELAVTLARRATIAIYLDDLDNAKQWLQQATEIGELARYSRSRDMQTAQILVLGADNEFEQIVNTFSAADFENSSYLLSLVGLFEYGAALYKTGATDQGRKHLTSAYDNVRGRYAESFLPQLDIRLRELNIPRTVLTATN